MNGETGRTQSSTDGCLMNWRAGLKANGPPTTKAWESNSYPPDINVQGGGTVGILLDYGLIVEIEVKSPERDKKG